jgi:hypothetical protein
MIKFKDIETKLEELQDEYKRLLEMYSKTNDTDLEKQLYIDMKINISKRDLLLQLTFNIRS